MGAYRDAGRTASESHRCWPSWCARRSSCRFAGFCPSTSRPGCATPCRKRMWHRRPLELYRSRRVSHCSWSKPCDSAQTATGAAAWTHGLRGVLDERLSQLSAETAACWRSRQYSGASSAPIRSRRVITHAIEVHRASARPRRSASSCRAPKRSAFVSRMCCCATVCTASSGPHSAPSFTFGRHACRR